jgi:hypothetical protein
MNKNTHCTIDDAEDLWPISKAALRRMDREGLIFLVPHDGKLWVKAAELRRVVEAAEDCPSLLWCTCGGPCNCYDDT